MMIKQVIPLVLVVLVSLVASEVYFKDNFESGIDKWVLSDWKGESQGKIEWSAGEDANQDSPKGLKTTEDNRFYTASARFDKEFSNKGKDLVVQYSVRHERSIECGGSYIKLYPGDFDQTHLDGDQKYNIMFGPDSCGSTRVVHFIFNYNGENRQLKKKIKPETDTISHLYTLIIHPNKTYEILIDGASKQIGNLEEDFDLLLPKEIDDPKASKPADWVDLETIDDPNDVKPEGFDVPETIEDTSAKKPEDWDDEVDGDWEPPRIPNPDYKGEWKAKKIPNPEFKGKWVHPKIANPDYKEDADLYAFDSFTTIGIEVWQVKAVSIFNDFLITDSVEEAKAATEEFLKRQEAEKEEKKRLDEEKKKEREEAKKLEEETLKKADEKVETETETKEEQVQDKAEEVVTEKKDEL